MGNEQLLRCYNRASIGPLSSRMLNLLQNHVIDVKGQVILENEMRCP